ncbi:hypothetical protein GCM10027036_31790 [Flavihumibacter cheonanensis]|uniref:hypothetical protein n=1 Tax=Flavihumibacter cheonanensis TaxID=1442385 RepID=UPI001EF7C87A|nr:hypothetical protein [Flavihumibacter cheonanensis]MCG7752795.1 hypothetical protein [Flavihumibacter cheonanensis]
MKNLYLIYFANVIVAGWISIISLFYPHAAKTTIFSNTVEYSEVIRLVGALWGAIFILSLLGLGWPKQMQLVLLFQLIYKSTWLIAVAAPALYKGHPFPTAMAVFFIIWCLVLPFVIDWNNLFSNLRQGDTNHFKR